MSVWSCAENLRILQLASLDEDSGEALSLVTVIKASVSNPVFNQILAYVV